ncbi:hypothetical protein A8L45_18585 [Veronia pacifica]|uniref:Uncharacterized protein n=2 Tax=Veronia pacifica TaxID=1080227 RepID=A0A1C3ECN0_9GAMM|nr:hypothetical protein A8L45_18585 [Veronia pacifica]
MENRTRYHLFLPLLFALSGCQSSPQVRLPAIAIPLDINSSEKSDFPCYSLALQLSEISSPQPLKTAQWTKRYFYSQEDTVALFESIPPGTYRIESVRCNSKPGRMFSGRVKSVEKRVSGTVQTSTDTLTVSRVLIRSSVFYHQHTMRFTLTMSENDQASVDDLFRSLKAKYFLSPMKVSR